MDYCHCTQFGRVSTKRDDKAEARLVAKELVRRAKDRDQLGKRDSCTIYEAADRYISELEAMGKAVAPKYRSILRQLSSSNSRLPVSKLDRSFLSSIKTEALKSGYSARYINNILTFWISVYTKARKDYELDVADVDMASIKLQTTQKTRYLLDGEEARLLAELDPQREVNGIGNYQRDLLQDQYDLVIFLLDTGARYSEVSSIQWYAIDTLHWKTINIYRSKVGNEGTLTMTDRLADVLRRRSRTTNGRYVFPARDRDGSRGYSTKGIRAAIQRAGLNDPHLVRRYGKFTPHSFRHTFASRLVQGGMSLYAVSRLLGHSTTTMTQRYAHLSPSAVADEAASILNGRN